MIYVDTASKEPLARVDKISHVVVTVSSRHDVYNRTTSNQSEEVLADKGIYNFLLCLVRLIEE